MKRYIIIILIILSFFSCQNYDSEKYIKIENKAINDIILEMTKFEEMKRLNEWRNEKLKLYIVSTLDTATSWTRKPEGYIVAIDDVDLSKEEIEQNKKVYEEELAEYEREEELFIKFKNGKIKRRKLNYSFQNEELNVQLIEADTIKDFDTKENIFGYLFISRIVFNRNFTKGYLHFSFICGIGCMWDNNIEIRNVNGKWKITEYFSGGIA